MEREIIKLKMVQINENLSIREINLIEKDKVRKISELHREAFPDFFLTKLGKPFLSTLYRGYLEDSQSGIIVAEKGNKIVGIIAYSKDYPNFYKGLIKHHLLKFAFYSAGAVIRHPSFIRRLLGAFKKSDSVVKPKRYVELASICVNPCLESRGVGTQMIDYLKSVVDFNEYAFINLETDADGNDSVNRFYIKNGFEVIRQYTTAEGRRMNEYRYYQK